MLHAYALVVTSDSSSCGRRIDDWPRSRRAVGNERARLHVVVRGVAHWRGALEDPTVLQRERERYVRFDRLRDVDPVEEHERREGGVNASHVENGADARRRQRSPLQRRESLKRTIKPALKECGFLKINKKKKGNKK
jgi:hypothetical protein